MALRAWWDALALRGDLQTRAGHTKRGEIREKKAGAKGVSEGGGKIYQFKGVRITEIDDWQRGIPTAPGWNGTWGSLAPRGGGCIRHDMCAVSPKHQRQDLIQNKTNEHEPKRELRRQG